MAIIKHLTKEDYLTSTCKSKTFEDLGERLNELEQELLVPLSVSLENEDGTFLVGTDKEGQTVEFEEGFASLEIHGKSEQETRSGKNLFDIENGVIKNIGNWQNNLFTNADVLFPTTRFEHLENGRFNTFMDETNVEYFVIYAHVTVKPNTNYTLSRTTLDSNTNLGETQLLIYGENGIFLRNFGNRENAGTFMTEDGMTELYVGIGINKTGKNYYDVGVQFEEDTTSTNFEKFGQTPSPNLPSEIKSVGEEVEVEIDGVLEKRYKIGISSKDSINEINGDGQIGDLLTRNDGVPTTGGSADNYFCSSEFEEIQPNTKYYFWHSKDGVIGSGGQYIYFYDKDKRLINGRQYPCTEFVSYENAKYLKMMIHRGSNLSTDIKFMATRLNVKPTEFSRAEKTNKTTLLLNEPLRSLPNGTHDTICYKNGNIVVTRICEEIVYDGTEKWNDHSSTDTHISFYTTANEYKLGTSFYCDKFKGEMWGGEVLNKEYAWCHNITSSGLVVEKTRLETLNVNGFKKWLGENPVKVIRLKQEPTEEIIHQSLNPYVYEKGHLTVESGEVQAPTVHMVNTNLKGTVEANAKEIELLKTNLDSLEGFYDNYLLESDYAIAKTGLDIYFDYMMEE